MDSFIVRIKTNDVYTDVAKDVETTLDAPYQEVKRPLPTGKTKKSDQVNER